MGLKDWWGSLERPQYGANSPPFGGNDSSGTPMVEFSPSLVEAIRLDGWGMGLDRIYETQPAVRICVNFLASSIAHCKLKSYQGTDESRLEVRAPHPLPTLLARPNKFTTGFDLMKGTVSDIGIYDTAYWWKVFLGSARAMFRIPPSLIKPRGGSSFTGPDHYELLLPKGGHRDIPAEEVVDFSGYNPMDTRIGTPPLQALRYILAEDLAASRHRAGYYKNSARREGLIEFPQGVHLSPEAAERLREGWENKTKGEDNSGKTAILEDGGRFRDSSWSPRDSEFIEGREFTLDLTATVYNIPLAVLSRKSTATFASMKEFRKMLYVDTLGPWNARIEGVVWLQLVPDFGDPDLYVEFNIEEKLQGDFGEQADGLRSHVQVPDWSVNESRRKQNKEPFGNPDDPDNVFNWPARPTQYTYESDAVAPSGASLTLAPAASRDKEIAELERIMEVVDE